MNKKKKIAVVATSVALLAVATIGGTLAYFTDRDEVTNTITMGHVDIKLEEPEFEKNPDNTVSNVKPNQIITKDPQVVLVKGSEDAYIRVKVSYNGLTTEQASELEALITTADGKKLVEDTDWVKSSDGYFYYQKIVKAADENVVVPFFKEVKIPEKWGNEIADKTFTIDIVAEAIQADNFNPDQDKNSIIDSWNYEDGVAITPENYTEPVQP